MNRCRVSSLIGSAKVAVDQRVEDLPLPARELEPVRLEFVAAHVARVQLLPLCDEHTEHLV
jgi:hypothetical protein